MKSEVKTDGVTITILEIIQQHLYWNRRIEQLQAVPVQDDCVMHNVTTADVIQSRISILNQSIQIIGRKRAEEVSLWKVRAS